MKKSMSAKGKEETDKKSEKTADKAMIDVISKE